ncbi:MAG: flagellar hook-basal body complex protein FliE [Proteobacteria bacterium]|nr:flagellar hook-basal body complex protein FliE [Pseudomonadota bacterium]MDE3207441.1 flagellar hook-basal body complex protein FliE [Pseudomonadota bacterium]
MDIRGIDQLLSQLQTATGTSADDNSGSGFSDLLKKSIDQVNTQQQDATKLAQAFSAGSGQASLNEVMASLQQASLSFQTMVQVRDKLVTAYQDIMNMQV